MVQAAMLLMYDSSTRGTVRRASVLVDHTPNMFGTGCGGTHISFVVHYVTTKNDVRAYGRGENGRQWFRFPHKWRRPGKSRLGTNRYQHFTVNVLESSR